MKSKYLLLLILSYSLSVHAWEWPWSKWGWFNKDKEEIVRVEEPPKSLISDVSLMPYAGFKWSRSKASLDAFVFLYNMQKLGVLADINYSLLKRGSRRAPHILDYGFGVNTTFISEKDPLLYGLLYVKLNVKGRDIDAKLYFKDSSQYAVSLSTAAKIGKLNVLPRFLISSHKVISTAHSYSKAAFLSKRGAAKNHVMGLYAYSSLPELSKTIDSVTSKEAVANEKNVYFSVNFNYKIWSKMLVGANAYYNSISKEVKVAPYALFFF